MLLKFKKMNPDAVIPQRATAGSVGMDVSSTEDVVIQPGEWKLVDTGLSSQFNEDFELQIRPRSGLAAKHGVTVLNSPGTVDSDFRGSIKVNLINHGKEPFYVTKGMRIAQFIIAYAPSVRTEEVTTLSETTRGDGGFGSTGV